MITINGEVFKDKIISFAITTIDFTESNRNALGNLFMEFINRKDKLELEFAPMTQAEMRRLLLALDPLNFQVTYTDAKGDTRTSTFYKGDRVTPVLFVRDGKRYYDSFKISLIEC